MRKVDKVQCRILAVSIAKGGSIIVIAMDETLEGAKGAKVVCSRTDTAVYRMKNQSTVLMLHSAPCGGDVEHLIRERCVPDARHAIAPSMFISACTRHTNLCMHITSF